MTRPGTHAIITLKTRTVVGTYKIVTDSNVRTALFRFDSPLRGVSIHTVYGCLRIINCAVLYDADHLQLHNTPVLPHCVRRQTLLRSCEFARTRRRIGMFHNVIMFLPTVVTAREDGGDRNRKRRSCVLWTK